MIRLFLLSERQMARICPYFPLSHGVPRVDDRRVVSGIVYVIKNGLQWKDAHHLDALTLLGGYFPSQRRFQPPDLALGAFDHLFLPNQMI